MTAQNSLCRGLVLWDTKDRSSAHWPCRSSGDLCPSVCSLCISNHVPHGRKQLQSPTLPNFGCARAESQGTESTLSIPTPCSSTVGCWSRCGAAPRQVFLAETCVAPRCNAGGEFMELHLSHLSKGRLGTHRQAGKGNRLFNECILCLRRTRQL